MRLVLLTPPVLVAVEQDGVPRRAWLLARRGDRCFLCVSRGPGDNALRWLDVTRLRPASDAVQPAPGRREAAPVGGLPRAER